MNQHLHLITLGVKIMKLFESSNDLFPTLGWKLSRLKMASHFFRQAE